MTTTQDVRLNFTDRLAVAMHRTGMNREELARYLGVDPSSIWRWMNKGARPRVSTLRVLAAEANVPYEWLKPGPDDEDPASVVHPLGLEPRTHWLRAWDVVGAAENLLTLAALDFDRDARYGHDARA